MGVEKSSMYKMASVYRMDQRENVVTVGYRERVEAGYIPIT